MLQGGEMMQGLQAAPVCRCIRLTQCSLSEDDSEVEDVELSV